MPAPGQWSRAERRSASAIRAAPWAGSGEPARATWAGAASVGAAGVPRAARDALAPAMTGGPAPAPASRPGSPGAVPVPAAPRVQPAPRAAPRPRRRGRSAAAAGRELRRGVAAIGLCTVMAGALVWACVLQAAATEAATAARADIAALSGGNQQLQAELAGLESPARVEALAITRLGLQRPAGYVPVPLVPVTPAAAPGRPATVVATLPLPAGPAPGGAPSAWRALRAAVAGVWRRVAG